MTRQQEMTTVCTSQESRHLSTIDVYKSKFLGDSDRTALDVLARQSLSNYAYKEIFLPNFKASSGYEYSQSGDGNCYRVVHKSSTSNAKMATTPVNGRCSCKTRKHFINEEQSKTTISNICIECTMLSSQGAIPMEHFTDSLFQTSAVISWITRSTKNVVVNLLDRNNVGTMLSQQRNELTQRVALKLLHNYCRIHKLFFQGCKHSDNKVHRHKSATLPSLTKCYFC